MTPHDFWTHLIALRCIDGDVMKRAGFCEGTIERTMKDATRSFRDQMTDGERTKFWPLVEQYLDGKKEEARVFALEGAESGWRRP